MRPFNLPPVLSMPPSGMPSPRRVESAGREAEGGRRFDEAMSGLRRGEAERRSRGGRAEAERDRDDSASATESAMARRGGGEGTAGVESADVSALSGDAKPQAGSGGAGEGAGEGAEVEGEVDAGGGVEFDEDNAAGAVGAVGAADGEGAEDESSDEVNAASGVAVGMAVSMAVASAGQAAEAGSTGVATMAAGGGGGVTLRGGDQGTVQTAGLAAGAESAEASQGVALIAPQSATEVGEGDGGEVVNQEASVKGVAGAARGGSMAVPDAGAATVLRGGGEGMAGVESANMTALGGGAKPQSGSGGAGEGGAMLAGGGERGGVAG